MFWLLSMLELKSEMTLIISLVYREVLGPQFFPLPIYTADNDRLLHFYIDLPFTIDHVR